MYGESKRNYYSAKYMIPLKDVWYNYPNDHIVNKAGTWYGAFPYGKGNWNTIKKEFTLGQDKSIYIFSCSDSCSDAWFKGDMIYALFRSPEQQHFPEIIYIRYNPKTDSIIKVAKKDIMDIILYDAI